MVGALTLPYDAALPHYGTHHGVLRGSGPGVVTSPPIMWLEALDATIAALVRDWPREMARLAALSGAAQQHGSVYLTAGGVDRLTALDPRSSLVGQLDGGFACAASPVWLDSSTSEECRAIEASVGGARVLAGRTGSRAFERFTGPQIRKFFKQAPEAYAATARVHLVSSFLASALAGADAPVEPGDASGMNLLDLRESRWWPPALAATAPAVEAKLPPIAISSAVVGPLASYWCVRFGLPAARVVVWSGDNPCSLIGTGLVREGRVAVSLGTSDTIFGLMREPRVSLDGVGHVFGAPTGDFMGMTVFSNGSLARERVRDAYGMDWSAFSAALRTTPAGNGGAVMLPWFDPEITPHVVRGGVRRMGLEEHDAVRNVRAVVEGQMMSMAEHAGWMGVNIRTVHATGGASANRENPAGHGGCVCR